MELDSEIFNKEFASDIVAISIKDIRHQLQTLKSKIAAENGGNVISPEVLNAFESLEYSVQLSENTIQAMLQCLPAQPNSRSISTRLSNLI